MLLNFERLCAYARDYSSMETLYSVQHCEKSSQVESIQGDATACICVLTYIGKGLVRSGSQGYKITVQLL